MPIAVASFAAGRANRLTNPLWRWHLGGVDEPADDPALASNRLGGDYFPTRSAPPFRLSFRRGVFTSGSCFARNIERGLKALGVEVLSLDQALLADPAFHEGERKHADIGFLNRYNTPSMALEFQRCLGGRDLLPTDLMIETQDGLFEDGHYPKRYPASPLATCLRRRELMRQLFSKARRADAFIITLGVNEVWYDVRSGLPLNSVPKVVPRSEWDNYECRMLSVADNIASLGKIHEAISSVAEQDFRLIVTVSPVPVGATFFADDIVVANTASKSILRAAAAEFCSQTDRAHYFQSYEIVMNSDPAKAFYRDKIHVRPEMVEHVLTTFLRDFADEGLQLKNGEQAPLPAAAAAGA